MAHFDFKEIFDEDYLYFYEPLLTEERLQREIQFLAQKTNLNEPKQILDLACGHGRHANRLSQMGHRVTGIDSSTVFLNLAKKRALELKDQITKVSNYCVRFYNPSEVRDLLEKAGFKEIFFYDDFNDQRLTPQSRRMVAIATK
ncbi:class I SAM-dependent methyltransferase [Criblamydia sequanensis]|uniref:Methyltransferase n=1 Tax=Candidatus Criblamydia sequanensis CRIB-18 TaxID=1437425 RepID=A0A090DZR9_9BACT|nr:class I SAM-dependent methyltransferase [Criblamydia sequanensis]CDR34124.1 Methyltransferase [Criblamydia sequanensis CRIB-18]